MTQLREVYFCEICGNVVEILNEGAPALVCCGQNMKKLQAQTQDASLEKHVPFVEEKNGGVLVKVGQNTAHPMEEKHHIKFIEVHTKDTVCKAELKVGEAPEAWFPLKKQDIIYAREWCNVHGLWKS